MHRQRSVVVVVLVMFAWSGALAEQQMHACSLLTSAEVSDAVGAQAGSLHESDIVIPEGPSQGDTMGSCMWPLGDGQSVVSVNVIRALQGAQREAGLAQLRQVFEGLKAQGWTEAQKMLGNATCATLTPPPSATDAPTMVVCLAEAKQMAISVGWMAEKGKKVAAEKIKALLDTAVARLP
jgi:hypothetical protein